MLNKDSTRDNLIEEHGYQHMNYSEVFPLGSISVVWENDNIIINENRQKVKKKKTLEHAGVEIAL